MQPGKAALRRGPRVLIVGAGPIGMTAALELAHHGVSSVVLEQLPALRPDGSRAVVLARHTLETFSRLGCTEILDRGIRLEGSRTYYRTREIGRMDFPLEEGTPRLLNLQQVYTERILLDRISASPHAAVEFGAEVTGIDQSDRGVRVTTTRGTFDAEYVIATDGAHSTVRELLGMPFEGTTCSGQFLLADVRVDIPGPKRRSFWFDPPSNRGYHIWLHPQPDGVWRMDYHVPVGTDYKEEEASGKLDRRIRALLAEDQDYEVVCLSNWRFHQKIVGNFRAGRVFLAGDAAHLMAPFGARGLNSGVEDVVNLTWKLALVLAGEAPDALLDTYDEERRGAALVNLRMTQSTADFIMPPTPLQRAWKALALRAAVYSSRARRYVNDVRFTTQGDYHRGGHPLVGRPAAQRPQADHGPRLVALVATSGQEGFDRLVDELADLPVEPVHCPPGDPVSAALGIEGSAVVLRPDGYVDAVVEPQPERLRAAVAAALGNPSLSDLAQQT
jgi:2-polyprenyl-6-methoxyphenol hydroxylase-like FAD-dependent oxidoreductase